MALRILRVGHLRGRPPGLAGGMSGAKISHSRSERSLGYRQSDGDIGDSTKASVLLIEPIIYLLAQLLGESATSSHYSDHVIN